MPIAAKFGHAWRPLDGSPTTAPYYRRVHASPPPIQPSLPHCVRKGPISIPPVRPLPYFTSRVPRPSGTSRAWLTRQPPSKRLLRMQGSCRRENGDGCSVGPAGGGTGQSRRCKIGEGRSAGCGRETRNGQREGSDAPGRRGHPWQKSEQRILVALVHLAAGGRDSPSTELLCDEPLNADRFRASSRQHPVQHRHADGSLGLLGGEAAGPQPGSDQRLVATHRRFH